MDGTVWAGERLGRRSSNQTKVNSRAEGCRAAGKHPARLWQILQEVTLPIYVSVRQGTLASPKLTSSTCGHHIGAEVLLLGLLVTKLPGKGVNECRQCKQQACSPGRNSLHVHVQLMHLLPQKTSFKSTASFHVAQPKLDLPPPELLKEINIKA